MRNARNGKLRDFEVEFQKYK